MGHLYSANTEHARAPAVIITRSVADASTRPETKQIQLVVERRMFLKRRWRATAADGMEFGFDLMDRLVSGCVIYQTPAADYIVRQEPEPVYVLEPSTAELAALAGWKIGNLHMPVEVLPGCIRVLPDPAVLQLFDREGWTWREEVVVFNPLRVMAHAS